MSDHKGPTYGGASTCGKEMVFAGRAFRSDLGVLGLRIQVGQKPPICAQPFSVLAGGQRDLQTVQLWGEHDLTRQATARLARLGGEGQHAVFVA